ncbi:thiamine pyrophosphate-binding protein [Bacillus solimangrovi]|uniref:Acetolactate synthase n=1 Tax=Bacillus solimangrovi TaxID=1305675 RepID=A0A1E5LDD2_9BACI|nr:thiamine pyrophosphate-binding protein [Bacillus solimangrovi]OEH92096.1 acetolactate synthase [Bacillus solimangrovi]
MTETVLSILVNHIKHWNITHVFGIPGKPVGPIVFELEKQGISFVLSRHECASGYEASGYSLQSGTLGVALGTSGPGATNLITAAGQAMAHNLPVLFLTGSMSAAETGKSFAQDSSFFSTDLVKMFEPVTRFSARVERKELTERYIQHALEKAFSGTKGPVHLSFPLDVLLDDIEPFIVDIPTISHTVSTSLDNCADLLNKAKRPLLLLGKGVRSSGCYEEVVQFAEKWQIPVSTTGGGKGTFPTNHHLSIGGFGLGGSIEVDQYLLSGVDVMIVIGSSLSDMSTAGFTEEMYPEQVIHFDYNRTFVGKMITRPTLFIEGDAKENLHLLLQKETPHISRDLPQPKTPIVISNEHRDFMSSAEAVQEIRRHLPHDTLVFADAGSHAYYGVKYFDTYQPGTFIFDDLFIAMGNGIGMSIGAKAASPTRIVACITGDGCMYMHGTELATAVDISANVIFFMFNNGKIDMVEKGMKKWFGSSVKTVFQPALDGVKFAESMGARGILVQNLEDIEDAINIAMSESGPTLIELIVDPDEVPPTLKRDD